MKERKEVFDTQGEFSIMFSWSYIEEGIRWVDFKAAETVCEYEPMKFITYDIGRGVDSNCFDFDKIPKEDLFFKGFIKWDGCMEIHELNHHFCGNSNILQRAVDCIYNSAKEIMENSYEGE